MSLSYDEEAALSILQASSSSSTVVSFERTTRALIKKIATDLGIDLVESKSSSHVGITRTTTSSPILPRKRKLDDVNVHASDKESRKTPSMTWSQADFVPYSCSQTPDKYRAPDLHHVYPTPSSSESPFKRFRFTTRDSPVRAITQLNHAELNANLDALAFRAFSRCSHGINASTGLCVFPIMPSSSNELRV